MGSLVVDSLTLSLGKKDQKKEILHGLSLVLPLNKISVLVGESGSGKTTLLRAILGLTPYEGLISLDGIDLLGIPTKNRNFSYVNQDIALYPHLTLFQNIAFPLKGSFSRGEEIRRRVFDSSSSLGIEDCLARRPNQVSLGQCQRASLAKALVKKSELYLLDEPFANVDEANRYPMLVDIKRVFQKEGASVIYVTHSLREAYLMGDYFAVMEKGRIALSGGQNEFTSYVDSLGVDVR